jgi:hypothetical protein
MADSFEVDICTEFFKAVTYTKGEELEMIQNLYKVFQFQNRPNSKGTTILGVTRVLVYKQIKRKGKTEPLLKRGYSTHLCDDHLCISF